MSRSKSSSSNGRRPARRCPGSGQSPQYQRIGSEFGECSGCHRSNRLGNNGSIEPHFIPIRLYRPNLRPAISGGAVDVAGELGPGTFEAVGAAPLTLREFIDAWTRAAAAIKERHRKLTPRQKRGGRSKGAHTQQVRHDWQRLSVENRIRLEALWPKAWRERLPRLVQLASEDPRIDLVIGNPVVVGYKAPSGGQDRPIEYPHWIPEPEHPELSMVNITARRLPNRWRSQRAMLGGHRYDEMRQFANGAMDALALCAWDVKLAHGITGVLTTDVGLVDREQSVHMPVQDALQLWIDGVDVRAHLVDCLDRQSQLELKDNDSLVINTRLHISGVLDPKIRIVDPAVEFVLRWKRLTARKGAA